MSMHSSLHDAVMAGVLSGKTGNSEDDFIRQLRSVNQAVAAKSREWDSIDDVLESDFMRRSSEVDTVEVRSMVDPATGQPTTVHFGGRRQEFRHLPKGTLEPWSEYDQRIGMTPFFPETPNIVANRRGALFANQPTVEVAPPIAPFLDHIGRRREPYSDVLSFVATKMMTHGLLAVFVDFRPLPRDVAARVFAGEKISAAEASQRALNQPVLGVFTERQVLDWRFDVDDGKLMWVKLVDRTNERPDPFAPALSVETYRVVDRNVVSVWRVEFRNGKWRLMDTDIIPHGARDEQGQPEVPVVLVHPFRGPDGVGESMIKLSVRADLAALRLISDIFWSLHLHGNPQLVLRTPDNTGNRMATLGMGAGRYLELRTALPGGGEGEELAYLQLDSEGLNLIIDTHKEMVAKANELASRTPRSANQPLDAQSGIAKAWEFKTGEEKALNDHKIELETASNGILKLLTRLLANRRVVPGAADALSGQVRTSFDPSFVLGNLELNLDLVERIAKIAKGAGLGRLEVAALRRTTHSLVNLSDEERTAIIEEMREKEEALETEEEEEQPALPAPPPGDKEEEEEE